MAEQQICCPLLPSHLNCAGPAFILCRMFCTCVVKLYTTDVEGEEGGGQTLLLFLAVIGQEAICSCHYHLRFFPTLLSLKI